MHRQTYAVLDVETTGLHADAGDRVIEVAVLRIGPDWQEEGRLDTLVSIPRPVRATHVHGIRQHDLRNAPTFADIAQHIAHLVQGATIVGHYPVFDLTFLDAELHRMGRALPATPVIDTRDVCRAAGVSGRLRHADCCHALGVTNDHEHAAMSDVVATAALLRRCVSMGIDPAAHTRTWEPTRPDAAWPQPALVPALVAQSRPRHEPALRVA